MQSHYNTDSTEQITDEELIHTHVFRNAETIYYITSKDQNLCWNGFLEYGIICPGIIRLLEMSRDEFGVERVVRDVWR